MRGIIRVLYVLAVSISCSDVFAIPTNHHDLASEYIASSDSIPVIPISDLSNEFGKTFSELQKNDTSHKSLSEMKISTNGRHLFRKRGWTPSTATEFHWFRYAWYDFHRGITCGKGFYSPDELRRQLDIAGNGGKNPTNTAVKRPEANKYYKPGPLPAGNVEWRFSFQYPGRHVIVIDFVESAPIDQALFGTVVRYDLAASWWIHMGDKAWQTCDMPP